MRRGLVVLALLASGTLLADAHTWSGAVDGNWSNPSNWSVGGAPNPDPMVEPTMDLTFPAGATTFATNNDYMVFLPVNNLTIAENGYTLAGYSIYLNGTLTFSGVGGNSTITLGLGVTGYRAFVVSDATGSLTINGVIAGPVGTGFLKQGPGQLNLGGTSTISAAGIQAGIVNLTNGAGIGQGAGTSVSVTGTSSLQVQGATGVTVTVTLNVLGTNSFVVASSSTTFTGPVHLGSVLTTNVGAGARLTFTNLMDQIGSVTKTGAGTLVLGGNVNYSGNTQINGGTLLVNGTVSTSAIGVTNGTTLGGSGTTKVVTAVAGGTVAPGQSPGILTTGSVNLVSGSNYSVELNGATVGTGYDQLNVVGSISIGAATTLSVSLGYVPTPGTSFTIINNDGMDAVSGTFAGLPEGSTFTVGGTNFLITYAGGTGNDVVLTVVVPPSVAIAPPGSTTVCPGDMVTLTAMPSGGTGIYTSYQWYVDSSPIGSANAVTYDATAAGTYTVTVTDSASATSPQSPGVVLTDDLASPTVTPPADETVTQTLCM